MIVLVTGGGGFLGQVIIDKLLARGDRVHTINRSEYSELEAKGVTCFQGDICNKSDLLKAAKNCDAIIHTAAKAGVWGDYQDYYRSNVEGTKNVIACCQELGISKLVYTSSPSVVFDGNDQIGVDESRPYPALFLAHYPKTKAEAEKLVLNSKSDTLAVVSLRPHLIWGPGDNHLAPRIIKSQKENRLRLVGDLNAKIDAVYVDNAADAHIIALDKLTHESAINGKVYFVTNQEPWLTKNIINSILDSAGSEAVSKHMPASTAYFVGTVLELIYTLFRIKREPPMTRFVARQLATSHWFSSELAKNELGYLPKISMTEGFLKLKYYNKDRPI